MGIRNSRTGWGWLAVTFHWLTALAVIGLFASGIWMVDLTYYNKWYNTAPHWHKSIGMLLMFLLVARLAWRLFSVTPEHEASVSKPERIAAGIAQVLLYLLLFTVVLAGYLIPTANGNPVEVFDWFTVPASITGMDLFGMAQEDLAGKIHEYAAWALVIIAGVHAAGALKHHFIDRNDTLKRMLGIRS
ncbi:MAG: cytochrome b [Gammaproteobacteria bacterium]|nr:cytochrome b [Gammaproteobacteria bacterium]